MEQIVGYLSSIVNACALIFVAEPMFARKYRIPKWAIYGIILISFLIWGVVSDRMDAPWISLLGNMILYFALSQLYRSTVLRSLLVAVIITGIQLASYGLIGMLLVLLNVFVNAMFDSMLEVMLFKKRKILAQKELEISEAEMGCGNRIY